MKIINALTDEALVSGLGRSFSWKKAIAKHMFTREKSTKKR